MIFDLDPGKGIGGAVRGLFGLLYFPENSGGKGVHIDVPIQPVCSRNAVGALSKAIVVHIAKVLPDRFSHKSGLAKRKVNTFIGSPCRNPSPCARTATRVILANRGPDRTTPTL